MYDSYYSRPRCDRCSKPIEAGYDWCMECFKEMFPDEVEQGDYDVQEA